MPGATASRRRATLARSEGLALASLDLFRAGAFSADPERPLRADAAGARRPRRRARSRAAFQVGPDNPLVGLEGARRLLHRLGEALLERARICSASDAPRIGGLFDHLAAPGYGRDVCRRPTILARAARGLGRHLARADRAGRAEPRRRLAATRRPRRRDLTSGLVPFHKLSQWLAYSLIEPLEAAGIAVTGLDALTALAEYRNGGLLIDLGVLRPQRAAVLGETHAGSSEVVVEWRALTVALLDRLAERIRAQARPDARAAAAARILEGGTWAAGRRIARELRPAGGPPLQLASDGTLF